MRKEGDGDPNIPLGKRKNFLPKSQFRENGRHKGGERSTNTKKFYEGIKKKGKDSKYRGDHT